MDGRCWMYSDFPGLWTALYMRGWVGEVMESLWVGVGPIPWSRDLKGRPFSRMFPVTRNTWCAPSGTFLGGLRMAAGECSAVVFFLWGRGGAIPGLTCRLSDPCILSDAQGCCEHFHWGSLSDTHFLIYNTICKICKASEG